MNLKNYIFLAIEILVNLTHKIEKLVEFTLGKNKSLFLCPIMAKFSPQNNTLVLRLPQNHLPHPLLPSLHP